MSVEQNTKVFQFRIFYDLEKHAPKDKKDCEDILLNYFSGKEYIVCLGQLGGISCTYGIIGKNKGEIKNEDRNFFISWIKKMKISGKIEIGEICDENAIDFNADILCKITIDYADIQSRQNAKLHKDKIFNLKKR